MPINVSLYEEQALSPHWKAALERHGLTKAVITTAAEHLQALGAVLRHHHRNAASHRRLVVDEKQGVYALAVNQHLRLLMSLEAADADQLLPFGSPVSKSGR
jgi:plasmid maintenance system killer protein